MSDIKTQAQEPETAAADASSEEPVQTEAESTQNTAEPAEKAEEAEEAASSDNAEKPEPKEKKKKNFLTRGLIPSEKNMGYAFTIYTLLLPYFIWGMIALDYYGNLKEKYSWVKKGIIPMGIFAALDLLQVVRVFLKCRGKKKVGEPVNRFVFALIFSFNSMLMPDMIMGSPPVKANVLYSLLGLMLCMALYLVGLAVFSNPKIWFGIINGFFAFYGFMQFYIYLFRGSPIQFSDIFNIESAKEASDLYEFTFALMPIYAIVNVAVMIFIFIKVKISPAKAKTRIAAAVGTAVCCLTLVFAGKFAYDLGIKNRYIIMNFSGSENKLTYSNVGYNLMFYFDGMYNHVYKPDGYSDKKAQEILSQYKTEKAEKDKKPIIIGIMNESFADYRHIGDLKTDKDYMPCFNALKHESVYGYVTVSAYGGYSCNSEYEFLSGNTMGFLPAGSAAFTQYFNGNQESLVSYLNEQNYHTMAVTPCRPGLWNLENVYKYLQFDQTIYKCHERTVPVKEINSNISDETVFQCIKDAVRQNENKEDSLFIWTTTMQNHGDYTPNNRKTTPHNIEIQGIDNDEASIYLDSIYLSDKAFGELVDYFRKYDREIVIVMFGDHFPHIMDFTEALYGQDVSTLSTGVYARLHQTPFIIWSNKGTESKEIREMSLNYLSNEVMKVAGLPLSPYQQELEKIRETLPVISMFGYMNSDEKWFDINSDDKKTTDIRKEYNTVQYYRMFGKKDEKDE